MSKQNELSLMNYPGYAAAWNRLQELNGEYDEIDKYITSIHSELDSHEHANTLKDKKVQAILER
ncbi:MAG: hypothetical protein IH964_05630 [Candidatus Dadabacteria bacterium]|nr:hypothetical protein [Candidatus Dadabacteria bacterium]